MKHDHLILIPGALVFALAGVPALCQYTPADLPALDAEGLERQLKSGTWLIVEFGGRTCIPCRRMQPTLLELQARFRDKAVVRNFWIQESPGTARRYRVMLMPTQVIFDPSGREVLRHEGFWDQAAFLGALRAKGLP